MTQIKLKYVSSVPVEVSMSIYFFNKNCLLSHSYRLKERNSVGQVTDPLVNGRKKKIPARKSRPKIYIFYFHKT